MSIFRKLFRRDKNTVKLTAEEAFVQETPAPQPASEPEPVTEPEPVIEPAQEPEAAPAAEPAPEPEQPRVVFTKNLRVYAACANPDDAAALLRPVLIEKGKSVKEDSEGCSVVVMGGLTVDITSADEGFENALRRKYGVLRNADIAAVMQQISLFNLCLNIRITADSREKLDEARPFVSAVAETLNGFIEWDESALHTWDGKLLMSISGESELPGFTPADVPEDDVDPDLTRMEHSFNLMNAHGINYDCGKPVQVRQEDAQLRSTEEICSRAECLFACVLVASAYLSPKEIPAPAAFSEKAIARLQEQYNVINRFTQKEKQYLSNPRFHSAFMGRSEACAVLLWALGYIDLGWPDKATDTEKLGAVLKSSDAARLVSCARPRSLEEILDMQDLTFRLHSYTVMRENTAGINEDAVYERHYALNWLTGVNGVQNWDDVIPKT